VGTLTPLGNSFAEVADALLAGRSGIGPVRGFDVTHHPSRIAGQLGALPCPPGEEAAAFPRLDRVDQLARWCSVQALRDSGWYARRGAVRIGLVLGLGAEWLLRWEANSLAGGEVARDPDQDGEPLPQRLRRHLGLRGPSASVSAACASGNYALAQARLWLERGWVDVCLAGACDVAVTPMALAGFGNLRALSARNDAPAAASRPFDKGRDGFVMSEGGAVFVLEPAETARRRGARVYAELAGFGAASDAYHMVIPSPDPAPAATAVGRALVDAHVAPDEVDYINAHATSTTVGDAAEARALALVLGDAVRRVPVSSTKSMTGHLLTGAAAVEALACLAAIERGALPPTINLDDPDPDCALCHVPREARHARVHVTLSNSFGFGGSNTCLVLRKAG
jgi:3-oxoacyl-[acyl-carrier-protein] synthase II